MGCKGHKTTLSMSKNTPPTHMTKWVEASQLLHHDNITLDHNVMVLLKFLQNKHEADIIATYKSCINFTQPKDQRFIRPPIKAPNLTLSTKECNPDRDMITTKPTIQIQGIEPNIYDQTGGYTPP